MLRVTVFERGRIVRADSDADDVELGTPSRRVLPQRLYDRLGRSEAALEDRREGAVFRWRRNHCLVGPWVGVMQIPGLQLEILPKTDESASQDGDRETRDIRSNLMEMLLRGGLGAVRARGVADLALKRGNLHDQLVDAFLERTLFELRRGLDRGYATEEGNLATLRGKLVLSRHVAKNAAQKTRFYCRHDVLTEATQISVRLKQACRVLAARALPVVGLVKCQQVLALLDDVPDLPFRHREPDPVFTRQNERFADIYGFACMLLEGQAPDARSGEVETFSLLFNMEQVFERYISTFLSSEVMPRFAGASLYPQAKGHRLSLYRDRQEAVLRMAPDLLFVHETAGTKKTLIVDTKWKRLSEEECGRPSRPDLYQLYAYLHRYNCQRAYLLYPKAAGMLPRDLQALARHSDDHVGTVGVRFVDLNRKLWTREGKTALANELAVIVGEGLERAEAAPEEATA
ncbi:McrC family protein [Corallococcus interemptor]|uniref:McrC family protein n=1 Tax=Corallococcus interemptor TaxID=2316720 RepID=UPI003CFDFB01